jgi:hypothetical protein
MSAWTGELRVLSVPGEQKIQQQLRPEKLLYSQVCGFDLWAKEAGGVCFLCWTTPPQQ